MTVISKIEATYQRLQKARQVFDAGLVEDLGDGVFIVLSQRGRTYYTVDQHGCDCPDSVQRFNVHKGWCKHRLAVEVYKESQPETQDKPQKKPTPEEVREYVESLYGPQTEAA